MVRGWFVGNFEPSVFKTDQVEVAIKEYEAGDYEKKHFHRVATEITVILKGSARMNDTLYVSGDIVIINSGESTDFRCVENCLTVVVKVPAVLGDKYEC